MASAPNVLQTFLAHNDAEAGDVIVAFTDDGVLLFQNGRSEVIPLDLCLKDGVPGPNHKLSFDGRSLILNEGVLSSWFLPSNLIHIISIKRGQINRLDRDIEKIEVLGPERRELRSGSIHYWIRLATEANGTITPFEEATTPSEFEKSSELTEFSARTIEEISLPSTSREQTDAESLSTSAEYKFSTTVPLVEAETSPASQTVPEPSPQPPTETVPPAQPPASNTPPRRNRSPQRRPVRLIDFMSRQKTPPKSAPPPQQKESRRPKPNEARPDAARAGRTWVRSKKEPPRLTRDDVRTQLLNTLEVTGPSPALYQLALDLDHALWLKFGAINEDYVVSLRNLRKRLKAKGVRDSLLQRQLTPAAVVAQIVS